MTKPRPWPDSAKDARDNAAEEISLALHVLYEIVSSNGSSQQSKDGLAISIYSLQNALRWLESVGAQTKPHEPRWRR